MHISTMVGMYWSRKLPISSTQVLSTIKWRSPLKKFEPIRWFTVALDWDFNPYNYRICSNVSSNFLAQKKYVAFKVICRTSYFYIQKQQNGFLCDSGPSQLLSSLLGRRKLNLKPQEMKKKSPNTWLITNFRIPTLSNSTKAICVRLGIARSKGSDASGKPLPARCT